MSFIYNYFFGDLGSKTHNGDSGSENTCVDRTCVLEQGKQLFNRQAKREAGLNNDIKLMGEKINNHLEGFASMPSTLAKNNSELVNTTELSQDYGNKITRYYNEYPDLIANARAFTQKTDRNAEVIRNFREHVDLLYDIRTNKEGCYKQSNMNQNNLLYQSDMKDVSENTCKMRASDLGYSGFSIKKNSGGQLGCYLTNNIAGEKTGEIAIKPMTSYSFKKSRDATVGGLLLNGQVGAYKDNINNNLITDLTAFPGCDIQGSNVLINDKSVVATYGGNCKKEKECSEFGDNDIGLPHKCIQELWNKAGCTTDPTFNEKIWTDYKYSKKNIIRDMNDWATMTDDWHRSKCYGSDKSKWPGKK
jgi:hypothetical protein